MLGFDLAMLAVVAGAPATTDIPAKAGQGIVRSWYAIVFPGGKGFICCQRCELTAAACWLLFAKVGVQYGAVGCSCPKHDMAEAVCKTWQPAKKVVG